MALPAALALAVASLAVQGFADVETLGGPRPLALYALTIARKESWRIVKEAGDVV